MEENEEIELDGIMQAAMSFDIFLSYLKCIPL